MPNRSRAGLDVVVLHLEGFDPEDDVEIRVQLRGGGAEILQVAHDALARGLGHLVVAAPFPDHVGTAVAADVERRGVLEARTAVVRPDRHVGEVGHGAHQLLQRLAIVPLHDRVVLRHREPRQARAERMIDAGAAERRVFHEEPVGHRARLEHAHAGFEPVLPAEVREFAQVVEIRVEVERRPEALGQRRVDEVVEARRVSVELRIVFVRHQVLVRHVGLQAVDLAMGEAGFGQRRDVALGIEAAGGAPVLRVAGVPVRAVPAEGGGKQDARRQFLPRQAAHAVGQQPHRGEKKRTVACDDLARAVVGEAEPHPGGRGCGGRGELSSPVARPERDIDAASRGRAAAHGGLGEPRECKGRRAFTWTGGDRVKDGADRRQSGSSHEVSGYGCPKSSRRPDPSQNEHC